MSKGMVLVVDDNNTIRAMARKTLEDAGFSVVEAQNGAIGVSQAKSNDQLKLILADINMPVMGGLDMIRNIRQLAPHARTPILILSTENTKEMMSQGKAAGANGWMVKPFSPEKLMSVVNKLEQR